MEGGWLESREGVRQVAPIFSASALDWAAGQAQVAINMLSRIWFKLNGCRGFLCLASFRSPFVLQTSRSSGSIRFPAFGLLPSSTEFF